jgi:hypothetical protein
VEMVAAGIKNTAVLSSEIHGEDSGGGVEDGHEGGNQDSYHHNSYAPYLHGIEIHGEDSGGVEDGYEGGHQSCWHHNY